MGQKSKFFRAFVEGQTISDGRTITAEMIDEIVETFNVETYSPRINIEHISGFSPEPPFNGYGDVVAVKVQDDQITIAGKSETRRALYAQVDANEQLVALVEKGQKPYPSVELTPDYTGTGKVGLVALAFTDNPASIATQKLKFSRSAPGTLLAHSGDAVALAFDAKPVDAAGLAEAIKTGFAALGAMFSREADKPKDPPKDKPANDNFDAGAFATALGEQIGPIIAAAVKPANDGLTALQADFATLKGQLEKAEEPAFSRPPASGGSGSHLTDC